MGAVTILFVVLAVLPYVPKIILDIEGIFGAGTGEQKRKLALDALMKMCEASLAGATGANATDVETILGKIEPLIGRVIDGHVAGMNSSGALPKQQPVQQQEEQQAPAATAGDVPEVGAGV